MSITPQPLVRKPVQRHPWRFHRWAEVDGLVGLFGIIKQCRKCHLVEVYDPLSRMTWRGEPKALKDARGSRP